MTLFVLGLALLGLLQLGDVWTTNRVLDGGGRESNPALAWIMSKLGKSWWIAKLAIAGLAIFILWGVGPTVPGWITLVVLLAAYAWVCVHNYREGNE